MAVIRGTDIKMNDCRPLSSFLSLKLQLIKQANVFEQEARIETEHWNTGNKLVNVSSNIVTIFKSVLLKSLVDYFTQVGSLSKIKKRPFYTVSVSVRQNFFGIKFMACNQFLHNKGS